MQIRFGGVYQLTGVKNASGAEVLEEQKTAALRSYFRNAKEGKWHGVYTNDGLQWLSTVQGDKLFIALDDELGNHASSIWKKYDDCHHCSRFVKTAWSTVGLHHVAKAYLFLKEALYTRPMEKKVLSNAFKDAQPAELVITTEPKNLLDEGITNTVIRPL